MALIELEAALEICEKEYQERLRMLDYCGDTVAWNIGNAIKKIPTIDAAPVVHGRWIVHTKHFSPYQQCSVCGFEIPLVATETEREICLYKHCPECTARMDGGDKHEAD